MAIKVEREYDGRLFVYGATDGAVHYTADEARQLHAELGRVLAQTEPYMCVECHEGEVPKPGRICDACLEIE